MSTSRSDVTRRMRERLVPLAEEWQSARPDLLMTRAHLCQRLADELDVTRQGMSRYVGEAVASGRLLEIFPLPDWRVNFPDGQDLPRLYARPAEDDPYLYDVQAVKPESRGAGQISFVITPSGLTELLPRVRKRIGWPEPEDAVYYEPFIERRLRPETYSDLHRALIKACPTTLRASQASGILSELLDILRLRR